MIMDTARRREMVEHKDRYIGSLYLDIGIVPGELWILPEYREVTGTPPVNVWALLGHSGERERGDQGRPHAPSPSGPNWARRGAAPPFPSSLSPPSFSPSPTREGGGGNPTPNGSRTPPGRAIGGPALPLLHSFIYGGGGTP